MKVEQIYTNCLAEAAYFIESKGEVAIIDPLRETEPYLEMAAKHNATIKYVFETHFHADFVSGHIDLAKKSGADIVFGPNASPNFDALIAVDNQEFRVGDVTIIALHTPGHTMESTTYLLRDESGKDYAIFTGDTLFIGDVGRPDLAVKSDLTQADLAGHLFDSLHTKIMPLADDVIVYPAHGAGSACGKNMSKETFATLGHQKEYNYALKINDKEQFIKEVTHGLVAPPQYFPKNVMMNKNGYDSIDSVVERGIQKLTPDEFEKAAEHALILDVRHQKDFIESHIPQSMFIGLDGQFAVWVGTLIEDIQQPIILVAPEGREREAVVRLARVGYDNVQGYLDGGLMAWKQAGKSTDMLESISAEEFGNRLNNDTIFTVDVRKQSEYMSEHVIDVQNSPLDFINKEFIDIPENQPAYIHCAGGYRSVIAASILKRKGIHNLIDVAGGYAAIKAIGSVNVTEYVCPTTML